MTHTTSHEQFVPWTNVYGVCRSLLALSTLSTLALTQSAVLFEPAGASLIQADPSGVHRFSFFALLAPRFELARWIAVAGLMVVASGWRPRITGAFHAWITWSLMAMVVPSDGGDQVASNLTLLLLPLALTDPRRWHWDAAPTLSSRARVVGSRIAASSIVVIRLQMAIIYFHAAVGKFAVPEWVNGTAIYYWLLDGRIGFAEEYHELVHAALAPAIAAALLTWLPILLELCLFLAFAVHRTHWARKPLFVAGIAFHFGNVVFFGLVSFFLAMSAGLVVYLRPASQEYRWAALLDAARKTVRFFGFGEPTKTPARGARYALKSST